MEWDEATKALINDVAEKAADKTVERTLTSFGVDVKDPLQMQRDMQFIRSMRETWQSTKSRSLVIAVGIMVTGFFTFMWGAVKSALSGSHGS